ncbi:hypothetical protein RJ641_009156 [Dillenia turbinata]|uniref:TRP C-terminal domain-containing protein n=1 Tax=Dillenia turbinata TaxID=194707 RepID=A0AAN8UZS8_9MAGN
MALRKFPFFAWVYWILLFLCFVMHSHGSEVAVKFLEAPLAVSNVTSATFVFEVSANGNEVTCEITCKLDDQNPQGCTNKKVSFEGLEEGKHAFEVCATGSESHEAGCNSYYWTIDTVPPTAYVMDSPTAYSMASTLVATKNVTVYNSSSGSCIQGYGSSCSAAVACSSCSAVDACDVIRVQFDGSRVSVKFLEAPFAVSNITSATFVFEVSVDGSEVTCGITCKLDDQISQNCTGNNVSITNLEDGEHMFEVCATGSQSQEPGCASHNWTIDTIPPTANLTASTLYKEAQNVSINISFSEPCTQDGGFKCSSVDSCNLLVHGGGQVLPSTFSILQPDLKFTLLVDLSSSVQNEQVQLAMDENFCKDSAGNGFTKTTNSSLSLKIDKANSTFHTPAFGPTSLDHRAASKLISTTFGLTTLASGIVSISTAASLQSSPGFTMQSALLTGDPALSLFRTWGHIQVFALSRWIAGNMSMEYYEFLRGLEWSILFFRLPWEENGPDSTPPATSIHVSGNFQTSMRNGHLPPRIDFGNKDHMLDHEPPEPIGRFDKSFGWKMFEKLIFWTGVIDLSILVLMHVFIYNLLRVWKNQSENQRNFGLLTFPRIEISLAILALSDFCMASAALIHGRSASGMIVGILMMGIVSLILLFSFLFLYLGITCGKLLKYEHEDRPNLNDTKLSPMLQGFMQVTVGSAEKGEWIWKNHADSIKRFKYGPLFEDLRGPSKMGNGTQAPFCCIRSLFAGLGIYYTMIQFVNKVLQGTLNGFYPNDPSSKAPEIVLLGLSSFQFLFLLLAKPFIERRLQFVETVSVTTEVVMFAITALSKDEPYSHGKQLVGVSLMVLFLVSYSVQMINLWYDHYQKMKQLNYWPSLVCGLRRTFNGVPSRNTQSDEHAGHEETQRTRAKEKTAVKFPRFYRLFPFVKMLGQYVRKQNRISNRVADEKKHKESSPTPDQVAEEEKEETRTTDRVDKEHKM